MKKTKFLFVSVIVVAGLVATSCGSISAGSAGARGIPDKIRDARKNALAMEGDMIVGIGTAYAGTVSTSRTMAAGRADMDIIRQLQVMVEYMAIDLQAGSEVDHDAALSFQLEIQRTLARQNLTNATIVEEYEDSNGQYWVAARYSRSAAKTQIAAAVEAANRLAPHAAVSDWALDKMDAALDKALGQNNGLPVQFTSAD
jgi:hypothetical protein